VCSSDLSEVPMRKTLPTAVVLALATAGLATGGAYAHHEDADNAQPATMMTTIPEAWTMADWYSHSVYDLSDNKLGDIVDVLLDHQGKAAAIMIGVGGFLGLGGKDVAVPFDAVHFKRKDDKWYPVMNTTKDSLQQAASFKFDRSAGKWVPDRSTASTVGGPEVKR